MIILELLRVGGGFIMSRSSGKVVNWSTEVRPCVELLSRFWEILAKNKIISRKVRVKEEFGDLNRGDITQKQNHKVCLKMKEVKMLPAQRNGKKTSPQSIEIETGYQQSNT